MTFLTCCNNTESNLRLFVLIFLHQFVTIDICAQDVQLPICQNSDSEIFLQRRGYDVSYNQEFRLPNWVAWHLTFDHIEGEARRPSNAWQEDWDVPEPRANSDDYRGSGWSRGHMCPAGDNKWNAEAMNETFLYSNICPQNASLNSGDWNEIEIQCRRWAQKYGDIYIVCGPVLYNKMYRTIGHNQVVVPDAFFKVVLCLNDTPKRIAFLCKNEGENHKTADYVTTISQVEQITGIDFFPSLPNEIADKVKKKADINEW